MALFETDRTKAFEQVNLVAKKIIDGNISPLIDIVRTCTVDFCNR
jgi:hypothetical protein